MLSSPVSDNRCATPPGSLWGPMRKDRLASDPMTLANNYLNFQTIARPMTLMDYGGYTVNFNHFFMAPSFEEMGRGLLLGALDMWGANPWSRLSTDPCADLLKLKPGSHRTIRSLPMFHHSVGSQANKSTLPPNRLRQTELSNLKVGF